jgi:hypothetical protein
MGLESGTYIADLNPNNPVGSTDSVSGGDDHVRLVKKVVKNTFPGMSGEAWRWQTKTGNYTLAVASGVCTDNASVLNFTGTATLALPSLVLLTSATFVTVRATTGSVTVAPTTQTVNGAAADTVPAGHTALLFGPPSGMDWNLVVVSTPQATANSVAPVIVETQTASAGQTVFDLTSVQARAGGTTLLVFLDGLMMVPGVDYNETSTTVVTFTAALAGGEEVMFVGGWHPYTYQPSGTGAVTRYVQDVLADRVSIDDYDTEVNYNTARAALTGRSDLVVRPEGYSDTLLSAVLGEFKALLISVKDFGAVGNGVTDDTAAVNSIKTKYPTRVIDVYFPDGDYLITDTVLFDSGKVGIVMSSGARFVYAGTKDRPAVVIGADAVQTSNLRFDIAIASSGAHGFTDDRCVGLRIVRTSACDFWIRNVTGFTKNLQLYGSSGSGIAYNNFRLGSINDARELIELTSTSVSGFVNENKFFGGDIRNSSSYNAALSSTGIHVTSVAGFYQGHNNNVFYSPCVQMGDGNVGTLRIPFHFNDAGGYNTVHAARVETGRGPVAKFTGTTFAPTRNKIGIGYLGGANLTKLMEQNDAGLSYGNQVHWYDQHSVPSYDSGNLVALATGITATTIAVKGCFCQTSASTNTTYAGTGKILKDWVSIANVFDVIGVWVDTDVYKDFQLEIDAKATNLGRLQFVAYDASGTQLTSAGAGHPYVRFPFAAYATTFGGRYGTSADTTYLLPFSVGSDVAKIKIMFSGGTNPLYIRRFKIEAFPSTFATLPPLNVYSGVSLERLPTANPATVRGGALITRGEMFQNGAAAAGQPSYWQATASGYNAKAWVAATAYILNELAENDTGKVYVCTVAGTSAGAGGPTGTGTAITDNTVTWSYVGTLPTFSAGANL